MDLTATLQSITVVDLLVVILVVVGVVGALRRGGGVLAAGGSVVGSLLVGWLVAVAVATWGPTSWAEAAEESALVAAAPAPHRALEQVGTLLGRGSGPSGPSGPDVPAGPGRR